MNSTLNSTLNLDMQNSLHHMQNTSNGGALMMLDQDLSQNIFENIQPVKFDEFTSEMPCSQPFESRFQNNFSGCETMGTSGCSSFQDTNSDSQQLNNSTSAYDAAPEYIQQLLTKLTPDEQQILYRLDFYCFDQAGCRMLQQMIQDGVEKGPDQPAVTMPQPPSPSRKAFLQCLVHFMLPIISDVMVNQFGNYLCQRIMEVTDSSCMEKIVNQIIYDLVPISLNIHGTRVIQILIERLSNGILESINGQVKVI